MPAVPVVILSTATNGSIGSTLGTPQIARSEVRRAAVLVGCSVDAASTGYRQLDLRLRFGSVTIDYCSKTSVGANVDRLIEVREVCISATAATVVEGD